MAALIQSHTILKLPHELFGLIVAKLSLVGRFQLRCVCKQWNAILHDTRFLKNHFQLTRHAPLCFWSTKKGFAAYSPETRDWHTLSVSFIFVEESGPSVKIKTSRGKSWVGLSCGTPHGGLCCFYEVFGSAGGLVLVSGRFECRGPSGGLTATRGEADRRKTLYLAMANPMTRSSRRVTTVPFCKILGMVLDESSVSYKIFGIKYNENCDHASDDYDALSDDDEGHFCQNTFNLYMYDSGLDSYEVVGEWRLRNMKSFDLPMFHRGVLHSLITKYPTARQRDAGYRIELLRFDGGKSWHQLPVPIPRGLVLSNLFEWQGNLMLLAVKEDVNNEDTWNNWVASVEVWQLDEEKVVWMESTTMPDDLLHRFSPSEHRLHLTYRCHSGGGYVYLTSYSIQNSKLNFVRQVICDLLAPSWWEVSEPPCSYSAHDGNDLLSFLLNPSFDTIY